MSGSRRALDQDRLNVPAMEPDRVDGCRRHTEPSVDFELCLQWSPAGWAGCRLFDAMIVAKSRRPQWSPAGCRRGGGRGSDPGNDRATMEPGRVTGYRHRPPTGRRRRRHRCNRARPGVEVGMPCRRLSGSWLQWSPAGCRFAVHQNCQSAILLQWSPAEWPGVGWPIRRAADPRRGPCNGARLFGRVLARLRPRQSGTSCDSCNGARLVGRVLDALCCAITGTAIPLQWSPPGGRVLGFDPA